MKIIILSSAMPLQPLQHNRFATPGAKSSFARALRRRNCIGYQPLGSDREAFPMTVIGRTNAERKEVGEALLKEILILVQA